MTWSKLAALALGGLLCWLSLFVSIRWLIF